MIDISDLVTYNSNDALHIFDGGNLAAPLIASLYGSPNPVPGPFMSTQHMMFIRFVSDNSYVSRGFSLSYRMQLPGRV
jgi:hypothetical protein